ncbi:S-adenosyl-L-methionine-dependent methyltransferase [Linderina pennispora]|uniref:S-adenosyl-L-methionine-dependent methyltransferase n=1 Tax=Linderina pennispora TaxID=61395 RepID=A0A1Y1WB39_9FUNG|nr:S-adenosyl-L-methionine-dependent methyltransferase [Linderina pennispora]ORX70585.1 S-adenosyl-L-methionine-dependent methyltransferase [Linderina pennispora]
MPGVVNTTGKEHASQTGATIDQYGDSLNIIPVGTPTRDELELKYYYAVQASINKGLPFGSSHLPIEHFMSVVDYQGILQGFIAGLIKARRILEIGTFIGISAIFHANALKRNGVKGGADETGHKPIVSFEISEEYAAKARANIIEAGVDEYIDIIVGDANKLLAQLEGVTFDIAFLDADKISYKGYYETIMDKGLVNKDGLIIVDNTAFESVVAYIDAPEWAVALHEFNEHIRNGPTR